MSGDWSLVGGNPAPGEPGLIQLVARRASNTADRASDSQLFFERLTLDVSACGWEGEAADKFQTAFAPIGPDLGVMARSYESVSSALATYAAQLEGLQAEAQRALARAELARHRRETAEARLAAASRRVSDLSRQLTSVRADEAFKRTQVNAALWLDPAGGAVAERHALARSIATRRSIESALSEVRTEEHQARSARDSAEGELRQARAEVDSVRAERRQAEARAARAIRDALADQLKNKSNIEKGLSKVYDGFKAVGEFGSAFIRGDFETVVATIREVIQALDKILLVLTIVAVVVLVVLSPFTGGATAAAAFALATAAMKVLTVASIALQSVDLWMMSLQANNGWVDPTTGRVPTSGDLMAGAAWLAVSAVGFKFGSSAEGHFKRALYPRGTGANGHWFWGRVEIADSGRAVLRSTSNSLKSVAKGAIVGANDARDAAKKIEFMFDFLDQQRTRYEKGVASPYAGSCYAR